MKNLLLAGTLALTAGTAFAQPYTTDDTAKKHKVNWQIPDTLRVGDDAPEFRLKTKDFTREVALSTFRDKRPVVLIFGSYSCPSFRSQAGLLDELRQRYKDKAEFFIVYIREAHPVGGKESSINEREKVLVNDPTDNSQRSEIAKQCCSALNIQIPCLIDRVDDAVSKAYAAWPDRIYVIGADGKVAVVGKPGPSGFASAVQSVEDWLSQII